MTFYSLAQARRCLGIDAKTLRRWLADAQLPLPNHPEDGRKKGLSLEYLQRLACLHQRSLVFPPEPSSPPSVPSEPSLSDLTAQLLALQAQIAALHHQVATLTQLLPPPPPASEPTPAQPTTRPRALPARKTTPNVPLKPVHIIPRVEYSLEGRYVITCPKEGVLSFEPDTPAWFAWVAKQDSFRFVGKSGHFSAHHEWRVPKGAWRAHRRIRSKMHIVRLAPNQEVTIAVLEQAAQMYEALLSVN